MDLQSSKIELTKLILNTDNPEIIQKLISFLKGESNVKRISLTNLERKEIDLAIEMLDNGKKISLDDFLRKVS